MATKCVIKAEQLLNDVAEVARENDMWISFDADRFKSYGFESAEEFAEFTKGLEFESVIQDGEVLLKPTKPLVFRYNKTDEAYNDANHHGRPVFFAFHENLAQFYRERDWAWSPIDEDTGAGADRFIAMPQPENILTIHEGDNYKIVNDWIGKELDALKERISAHTDDSVSGYKHDSATGLIESIETAMKKMENHNGVGAWHTFNQIQKLRIHAHKKENPSYEGFEYDDLADVAMGDFMRENNIEAMRIRGTVYHDKSDEGALTEIVDGIPEDELDELVVSREHFDSIPPQTPRPAPDLTSARADAVVIDTDVEDANDIAIQIEDALKSLFPDDIERVELSNEEYDLQTQLTYRSDTPVYSHFYYKFLEDNPKFKERDLDVDDEHLEGVSDSIRAFMEQYTKPTDDRVILVDKLAVKEGSTSGFAFLRALSRIADNNNITLMGRADYKFKGVAHDHPKQQQLMKVYERLGWERAYHEDKFDEITQIMGEDVANNFSKEIIRFPKHPDAVEAPPPLRMTGQYEIEHGGNMHEFASELREALRSKYPNANIEISGRVKPDNPDALLDIDHQYENLIWIDDIDVSGEGNDIKDGWNLMFDIIKYADANNITIRAVPYYSKTGTTAGSRRLRKQAQLEAVYERAGFNFDNKEDGGWMTRLPKKAEVEEPEVPLKSAEFDDVELDLEGDIPKQIQDSVMTAFPDADVSIIKEETSIAQGVLDRVGVDEASPELQNLIDTHFKEHDDEVSKVFHIKNLDVAEGSTDGIAVMRAITKIADANNITLTTLPAYARSMVEVPHSEIPEMVARFEEKTKQLAEVYKRGGFEHIYHEDSFQKIVDALGEDDANVLKSRLIRFPKKAEAEAPAPKPIENLGTSEELPPPPPPADAPPPPDTPPSDTPSETGGSEPPKEPKKTPVQEVLEKVAGDIIAESSSLEGSSIAGFGWGDKQWVRMMRDSHLVNTILISPILSLAKSPFLFSRKVGESLGQLGLTRNQDYDSATATGTSIESNIKVLDRHRADIFKGLGNTKGIARVAKDLNDLDPNSNERILLDSVGARLLPDGKGKIEGETKYNRRVLSRIIGEATAFYGAPQESGKPINARGALRAVLIRDASVMVDSLQGRTDLADVDRLIDRILAPAESTWKLLEDVDLRLGESAGEVTRYTANMFSPVRVAQNKEGFIEWAGDHLAGVRERALEEGGKFKDKKVYAKLTDDDIDILANKLYTDVMLQKGIHPIVRIGLEGIELEGIPASKTSLELHAPNPAMDAKHIGEFQKLNEFRAIDMEHIVEAVIRKVAVDAELRNKLGTDDVNVLTSAMWEASAPHINRQLDNGEIDIREAQRMREAVNLDIRNATETIAYLRGSLQRPENYDAPVWQAERGALVLNNMRLMGGVLLSSIPETFKLVMTFGLGNTIGTAVGSFGRGLRLIDDIAKDDLRSASIGLDVELSTTGRARHSMDEYVDAPERYDDALNYANEKFYLASGVNHYNSTMKRMAGRMALNRMLHTIFDIADGKKAPKAEVAYLSRYGINKAQAIEIRNEIINVKATQGIEFDFDGALVANMDYWRSSSWKTRDAFRSALRQVTDDVIVTPGTDVPLFFKKAGFRLIGQFRSFNFASFQKTTLLATQMIATGDDRWRAVVGMSGMVGTGIGFVMLRDMLAEKETDWDDPAQVSDLILRGVGRSGLTGFGGDVGSALSAVTGGYVDPYYISDAFLSDDEAETQDFYSSSILNGTLGASAGLAHDLVLTARAGAQALAGDEMFSENDIRRAYRLAPMQNYLYWRDIFNKYGVNDIGGVPLGNERNRKKSLDSPPTNDLWSSQ